MKQFIFSFDDKKISKLKNKKNLLGGKGANLAEMGRLGLPVPPGFTITTEVCDIFYSNKKKLPTKILSQIKAEIKKIEKKTSKKFGDLKNPLLVSVRSGARISMPGMMDTILNLGLNDKTVNALASKSKNLRFAKDSYRRFIQMFSNVVMGVEGHLFEEMIDNFKLTKGVLQDTEIDASDWDGLIENFKKLVKEKTGKNFPQDVNEQLIEAVSSVFRSWESQRAKTYRKLNRIPDEWGTAVNVQAMVFGNMGSDCATGVAFTRNPSTGENSFFGEYLINAQGEDVVAGTRTPQYITKKSKKESGSKELSMQEAMPKAYKELEKVFIKLEKHYRDMQDIEFTVENNKLWMLQTRSGKRTAKAGIKIAVDMVKEKLISRKEAILRIDPNTIDTLLHPTLDDKVKKELKGVGDLVSCLFKDLLGDLGNFIKGLLGDLVENLLDAALCMIQDILGEIMKQIMSKVNAALGILKGITGAIKGARDQIQGILSKVGDFFKDGFNKFIEDFPTVKVPEIKVFGLPLGLQTSLGKVSETLGLEKYVKDGRVEEIPDLSLLTPFGMGKKTSAANAKITKIELKNLLFPLHSIN